MHKKPLQLITILGIALGLLFLTSCSATQIRKKADHAYWRHKNYEKATKLYEKAAAKGDAKSQEVLADCYAAGKGVKQNFNNALKWYRKAAAQGRPWSQYKIGIFYHYGNGGVAQDDYEAYKWFRKSADGGLTQGQNRVALCLNNGCGVKKDLKEAEKWWKKAAERDFKEAQYRLGCFYEENGNNKEAIRWFEECALRLTFPEIGLPFSEYEGKSYLKLGYIYRYGTLGKKIDLEKAKEYYEMVVEYCEDSDVKKEARQDLKNLNNYIETNAFNIGNNYYFGNFGYAKDKTKAVKYWKKSADNGNAEAQYYLGFCYSKGDGVQMNKQTAFYWYQKASNNGNAAAQYNLGCCYFNGDGCTQNKSIAKQWWKAAADQGNPDAQEALRKVKSRTIATGGIIAGGVALIANAISNNKSSNSSSTSSSNSKNSNSSTSNSENVLSKSGVVITRTEFYEHNVLTAKNDNTVLYIRNDNKYDVFVEIEMRVKGTWKECRITYDYRAATEPLNGSYADDRSSKIHLKANSTRVVEVTSYSSRRPDAIRITRVF